MATLTEPVLHPLSTTRRPLLQIGGHVDDGSRVSDTSLQVPFLLQDCKRREEQARWIGQRQDDDVEVEVVLFFHLLPPQMLARARGAVM
eukprot:2800177-Rhodomonas_salina.1